MADYILHNGELYHYGVLGMKWGKRKAKGIVSNDKPKRRFPVLDESQPKPKHMPPVLDEKSKKVGKGITEQIGDGIKNKIAEKKAQAKAERKAAQKEANDKYTKAWDEAEAAQVKAESYKEGSKERAQAQKIADMKWSNAKELYKNTSYKKGRDAAVAVAATAIAGITIAALYKKSKSVKEGKRYIDAVWREIK